MILEFVLYKAFTRIFKNHDSMPWLRTYVFMAVNQVFIMVFTYYCLCSVNLNLIKYKGIDISLGIPDWLTISVLFVLFPLAYTYLRFFHKRDINYYEIKYSNHWLNKIYSDIFLILLPFLIFLIAPFLSTFLFGGNLMNRDYDGILIFLFRH